MNERIKELVKQAGGHISMRNLASNPVQHIETVELWDDRIEKFAELIVRECMNICRYHPSGIVSNNWRADVVAQDIMSKFQEHFEVEE